MILDKNYNAIKWSDIIYLHLKQIFKLFLTLGKLFNEKGTDF